MTGEAEALLQRLLLELQAIRAEQALILAALDRRVRPDPHALLVAIAGAVGDDLPFTAAELLAHADLRAQRALRDAIQAAVPAPNPRRLGRLLRRVEGRAAGGLVLRRSEQGRDGVLWVLRVSEPGETRGDRA